MTGSEARFKLGKRVATSLVDKHYVAITGDKKVHVANSVATEILCILERAGREQSSGMTATELTEAVTAGFEVDWETAHRDVVQFVEELSKKGVLVELAPKDT